MVHRTRPNHFLRLVDLVRRNTTSRAYEEIHVESIISNEVFVNLIDYVKLHPKTMLMLTAPNELWCRMRVQGESLSETEYANILAQRYTQLHRFTNNMGLHVHLFHPKTIRVSTAEEQLDKIRQSLCFLNGLGFEIKDFAAGWWGYNYSTVLACAKVGISRFHCNHILAPCKGIEYVKVFRSCDDFQL